MTIHTIDTAAIPYPESFGRLADLPRARLFNSIPPIEAMPRLGDDISSKGNLFIKRDDLTELAFGGNKVRQLEYYLGAAVAEGADALLITSAVQSNFVRLAAAGAAKLGMEMHIQLEHRVATNAPEYHNSGNVLLDRLLGATLYSYPEGEDEAGADASVQEIAAGLKAKGKRPYIIPLSPGHAPLGALGYVIAAHEIAQQMQDQDLSFDGIVVASGSGNTHGGLLYGLRALGLEMPVYGICVRREATQQTPRIINRCQEIADFLEADNPVPDQDVLLDDAYLAPGYGRLNEATMTAILSTSRNEGILLDPTYTGKTMAGFLSHAKKLASEQNLLFIHTGGTPALFGYAGELTDAMT